MFIYTCMHMFTYTRVYTEKSRDDDVLYTSRIVLRRPAAT